MLGRLLRPTLTYMSRSSLPQVDGRLTLAGLNAPVEILRDRWGIPHLYAQNRADLFRAQGFVHGQDRFWQMEVNRRAATGQLAAMLGPLALETDRLTRTLGFRQIAAASWSALPDQMKSDVEHYCEGVNAFIRRGRYPVEFKLLRHRPAPWTPLDSLAFARLQLWALSYGYAGELARAQLTQAVGETAAAELEPQYPDDNPTVLTHNIEFNGLKIETLLDAARDPIIGRDMDGGGRGSNGWVIGPERSATGMPILCNDMHLPVTTPSIWYQIHLSSGDGFHVCGVSQPGMPYVLVGHNEHIAWGATLAFADVEDLFLERLEVDAAGKETGRYAVGDEWHPLTTREEQIDVKGAPPHIESVRVGRHGPLIGRLLRSDTRSRFQEMPAYASDSIGIALQSSALKAEHTLSGFVALNEATDWTSFTAAVARVECPPLNLIYADTSGNIGFYMSGKVPIRQQGTGQLPVPGWDNNHEWVGYVPFAEMPHALNPASGYLVTCNHRVVDDRYPHFISNLWVNGYRARRLVEQIEAASLLTLSDCARMQLDFQCEPGRAIAEALTNYELVDPAAREMQSLLHNWDGWLGTSSVAGTIYQFFLQESAHIILAPHLGPVLLNELLGTGLHETLAPITEYYGYWPDTLLQMLQNDDSFWLPGRLAKEALVERALLACRSSLVERFGADPAGWQWGKLHQVTFNHLLARRAPFDKVFSVGPFPVGGDTDTVTQTAIRPGEPYANNAFSVANRHIYDLGNLDNSVGMIAPGQSGHLASPHFDDLAPYWLSGEHHPFPWSFEAVEKGAVSRLRLIP